MVQKRFRKRAQDKDGNPIGGADENTILDSREYAVEFKDGTEAELAANAIAQRMYSQCNPNGHTYVLLDFITNFCQSITALCYADHRVWKAYGCTLLRQSTAG